MDYVYPRVRVLAFAVLLVVLLSSSAQSSPELRVEQIGNRFQAGKGYMEITGPVVFMHLKGTPYEMGLQHGTLLTQLFPEGHLLRLRDELNPLKAQVSGFERLVQGFKRFYFQYKMAPWIRRNIPDDLFQELEGLVCGVSGGADTDPMDIVVGNVSQDLNMTFGCTSIVAFGEATANGALYHARNLDNVSMMEWAQYGYVVVYEPDQGYPFITYTYPTYAGLMQAMNNQGITVSVNYSLVDQAANSLDGMAMMFLLRQIVQYASRLDEAVEIVLGTPRTFGMNIIISDSKIPDAVVLEVDANRFAVRKAQAGLLSATNRYSSEYMRQFQASGWLASERRDQRLAQFLADHYGEIKVESMVELLRDRGQPGSGEYEGLLDGINNTGSLLSCVFSPEEQMMWVSIPGDGRGSPDNEFYAFSLAKALAGEEPAISSRNTKPTTEDHNLANWLLVRAAALAYGENRLAATLDYLEQLDPAFSQAEAAINLRAHTHLRLGNQAEAQRYFQILAERPHVAEAYHLLEALAILGSLHDNAGERAEAVECYQAALAVQVADLAGNTPFYRQLAEVGLRRSVYLEFSGSSYYFTTRDSALARFFQAPQAIPWGDAHLYSQYDGRQITNVRVLGAHRTDEGLVARILRLEPGSPFDSSRLAAGKRRLDALGALDQVQMYVVPVGDNAVDIVVRISEGFGLYLDPVQFVVENALNLSQKTIALRYYNVAGTLASIGGGYGFGPSRSRAAYLSFPVGSWPVSMRYQSHTTYTKVGWGAHEGSAYSLERKDASVSGSVPIGEHSALGITLGYSQSNVQDITTTTGLTVPSGDYVTLALTAQTGLPGTTTWTREGTSLQVGVAILANRQDLNEKFASWHMRARHLSYLGAGFVARAEVNGAWTTSGTPFDRRLRLGGGGQLGASSPLFVGEMYLHSNLELQRYFTHDLAAHVNYEVAKIWEDATHLARSDLLHSVGGGLTYQTPIGVKIRAQYSKNLSLADTHSFSVGIVSSF
jgi:predicted choloylglycine hydrolase